MKLQELSPGNEKLGLNVFYRTGTNDRVISGKIKSWNDEFIFVVFNCDNQWDRWMDFTAEACKPEDLVLYGADSIKPAELKKP